MCNVSHVLNDLSGMRLDLRLRRNAFRVRDVGALAAGIKLPWLSGAASPDHDVSIEVASGTDLPGLEVFAEPDDEAAPRRAPCR
jgi:hypothetical protein